MCTYLPSHAHTFETGMCTFSQQQYLFCAFVYVWTQQSCAIFGISVCTYKAIVHSICVHIFSQSFANMCNSYMYVIARRQVFPPCCTFWHRVSDELFILTRCWLRMVRLWISFQTPELVGDNMARVTLLGGVLSRCRNLTAFLWKTAGASLTLKKAFLGLSILGLTQCHKYILFS